ncbi:hypothetical protein NKG94_16490 [Micromonospora sp. M12]
MNQYDLKCWYNQPAQWKTCVEDCGYELLRFDPGWEYEPDAVSYPPSCDRSGLPSGALVVDDVPGGTPSVRPGARHQRPTARSRSTSAGREEPTHRRSTSIRSVAGSGALLVCAHPCGRGRGRSDEGQRHVGPGSAADPVGAVHGAPARPRRPHPAGGVRDRPGRRVHRPPTRVQQRVQENRWVSLGAFPVSGCRASG